MKFKEILLLEVLVLALAAGQAYAQQTPTPSTAPHSNPTLEIPTIVFPRTDVKTSEEEIQPPTDLSPSNDNLGFYGNPSANNSSNAAAAGTPNPQTTSNNETIQKTVTALLANPGFNMQDDLGLSPTPAAGQTTPVNTPDTLSAVTPNPTPSPVNTALPSLENISNSLKK
jgi:hypothetical protein